jgi:hypothetical protein
MAIVNYSYFYDNITIIYGLNDLKQNLFLWKY